MAALMSMRFSSVISRLALSCTVLILVAFAQTFLPAPAAADAGAYSLTYQAADPKKYERRTPDQVTCPTGGRGASPIAGANFSDGLSSLAPEELALGQVVVFHMEIEVNGSTSPENGTITISPEWDAPAFGYDHTYGLLCAFVDTADPLYSGDGNESVTGWSTTKLPNSSSPTSFRSTVNIAGLDNQDRVIVELWVVLMDSIPAGTSGNIHTGIHSAQTSTGAAISIKSGKIPLNKLKNFFTSQADVSVQKMDAPDPVDLLGELQYTLEVTNSASDTVANEVTLTDLLDTNTAFKSIAITDTAGYASTCSHSAGVITCDLGFLNPLETVTITATVNVLASAKIGPGGAGPCDGSESLCNQVSITSINDDETSNNSVSQPTGVTIPGPFGALSIDKVPNADVVYPGTEVVYTYHISNSGTHEVADIEVTDDFCLPVVYGSGDSDGDGLLDPNETWVYTCLQTLFEDTTNIGTVTGTDYITGIPLSNQNSATVNVINPLIEVIKTASADTVMTGESVVYTYRITIPPSGDDPLDRVTVTDDKCAPVVYVSGDTNLNAILDLTEEWTYSCTTAILTDTTNTVTVTAEDSLNNSVSDTDIETVLIDDCPADPAKTAPGSCGCGVPDTDTDGDGTLDCQEECDGDPAKTAPGVCGCGALDTDSDGDGVADCLDECDADSAKTAAGSCGCGVPDTDIDGDGILDCQDGCPLDIAKTQPGKCGCGKSEVDADSDGTPDCIDQCPKDKSKIKPGLCGCGLTEQECLDCAGTPFGGKTFDICGECGGDGSSCSCIEVNGTKKWRSVRKKIKVLLDRTSKFSKAAGNCGSNDYTRWVKTARRLYRNAINVLADNYNEQIKVCSAGICTKVSLTPSRTKLRRTIYRLGSLAKRAKVTSISECKIPHIPNTFPHKVSEDYRDDALDALNKLPQEKSVC